MMIEVTPCALQLEEEVEERLAVVLLQRRGRLVEDQEADVLGERLGDLHELLLADAERAHRASSAPRAGRPWRGAPRCAGRCSGQSMTPPRARSLPRKMFSAIDRSGTSASSWWMMTMPAASLSWMPRNAGLGAGVADRRPRRCRAGRPPRAPSSASTCPAPFSPTSARISPSRDVERHVVERAHAREGLGDALHLEEDGHGPAPSVKAAGARRPRIPVGRFSALDAGAPRSAHCSWSAV